MESPRAPIPRSAGVAQPSAAVVRTTRAGWSVVERASTNATTTARARHVRRPSRQQSAVVICPLPRSPFGRPSIRLSASSAWSPYTRTASCPIPGDSVRLSRRTKIVPIRLADFFPFTYDFRPHRTLFLVFVHRAWNFRVINSRAPSLHTFFCPPYLYTQKKKPPRPGLLSYGTRHVRQWRAKRSSSVFELEEWPLR